MTVWTRPILWAHPVCVSIWSHYNHFRKIMLIAGVFKHFQLMSRICNSSHLALPTIKDNTNYTGDRIQWYPEIEIFIKWTLTENHWFFRWLNTSRFLKWRRVFLFQNLCPAAFEMICRKNKAYLMKSAKPVDTPRHTSGVKMATIECWIHYIYRP